MNSTLTFPKEAQFIDEISLDDSTLTLRLKPEALLVATTSAFVLSAVGAVNAEETYQALDALRTADNYVYVFDRGRDVVVSDEGGGEVVLRASSFSGTTDELTSTEFREALSYYEKLYGDAHEYGNRVQAKLQRVRDMLQEQERRTRIKGEAHPPESAAAVLYRQHAQFIQRLLRELDAQPFHRGDAFRPMASKRPSCQTLGSMKPSRSDIVAALQSMTERELAEVLYEALKDFGDDEETWCLAQVTEAPGQQPYIELVALPVAGYEHPTVAGLYEQGGCPSCKACVISVSKRAVCPVCSCEVGCT